MKSGGNMWTKLLRFFYILIIISNTFHGYKHVSTLLLSKALFPNINLGLTDLFLHFY